MASRNKRHPSVEAAARGEAEPRRQRTEVGSLRFLVTARPTREFIDSVRFISNPSTGKMGFAIAAAAAAAGHRVSLISGPVSLPEPAGVEVISVVTAAEMAAAARSIFRAAEVAVFTAAVCDYRPRTRHRLKLAKSDQARTLELVPTQDIAATLGRRKGTRLTIGFAMEDHDARAHAEGKLLRKRLDAIVLNGPENVGSDHAVVEFLARGGDWERWSTGTKALVAKRLVQRIELMWSNRLKDGR